MRILRGELNRLRILARPFITRRYLKSTATPKLHLGCGPKILPGWLNGDKFSPAADIYLNAYGPLPFPDDTFHRIYMEHLIEHVRIDRIPTFLSELHRVLRPQGILRITCPDLELFVRMYAEDNRAFFTPILEKFAAHRQRDRDRHWLVRSKGGAFNTRAVHTFFHHRWMYDFETLDLCLREVGFPDVRRQQFGESLIDEVQELDSPNRKWESLYLDAVK